MTPSAQSPVVCADRIRAMYREAIRRKTPLVIAVMVASTLLDYWLRTPWIGVPTVLFLGAGVVAPHIFRVHRAFASLPCPTCGKPVGKYQTRQYRVILRCEHCGNEAPTDCGFAAAGCLPHKM